jgi:hypothetical protein
MNILPIFSNWYFLYELCDPITFEVRYVGKTNNLKKRYQSHLYSLNAKTHKISWIKGLLAKNQKPIIRIIGMHKDSAKITEKEIEIIKKYKEIGINLTNGTGGGDGQSHITEETKQKIRDTKKKSNKKHIPLSDMTKKKISLAQIGIPKPKWTEERKLRQCKSVKATSLKTGEILLFNSARLAAKSLNCEYSGVLRHLNGKRLSNIFKDYKWEYK